MRLGLSVSLPPSQKRAAPYMGHVVGRTGVFNNFASSTYMTWTRDKSLFTLKEGGAALRLEFTNYYQAQNTNVETGVGPGTLEAVVECPAGSGNFIAAAEGPIATSNGNVQLNFAGVNGQVGQQIAVWSKYTNATGIPYFDTDALVGEGHEQGTGAAPTLNAGGSINQATSVMFCPAVVATARRGASVAIIGDSRQKAGGNARDAAGHVGALARAIGAQHAYAKVCQNGALVQYAIANFTWRGELLRKYFSHAIVALGFNDKAWGRSNAQVAADLVSLAGLLPGVIMVGSTAYNSTNSTDNWATLANQSVNVNDPQGLNALIKAGLSGYAFFYDVEAGLSGVTGRFPVAIPGTQFYATLDGIHTNTQGDAVIAGSGMVDASLIQR